MLSLHDTATGESTPLAPRKEGTLSLYVCGPTVYDVPHLGHGRSALVYDILRRYLEWSGWTVEHISNITDIDDKIIARAAEEGRPAEEIAAGYEEGWWKATDALGVLRPTVAPHATEYVERMVELIDSLIASGHAYVAPGGVWFSCESVPGYGLLAHQSLDSLRSGARVEVDEAKRSPVDFALWKLAKEGEPSWPSPWGGGRPGWHTECVVMSLDLLGDGFDLHAGGMDLMFPHHENERAQAVALGKRFALHWMHHAFVEVGGEKMSKSLGNYLSLTDLLEKEDPRALRLLTLRAHYRSPMEVTPAAIADATDALGRLDALARRLSSIVEHGTGGLEVLARRLAEIAGLPGRDESTIEQFRAKMDDDLDTPGAVAILFETIRRANVAADREDGEASARLGGTALDICRAFGIQPRVETTRSVTLTLDGSLKTSIKTLVIPAGTPSEIEGLATRREEARAARDWPTADSLREQLLGAGWVVEDAAGQTVLRPANWLASDTEDAT